jgi:hypothetical protein
MATTKQQMADENFDPGLKADPVWNAEREQANKAAQMDYARKMAPGQYAPLPNGQMVEVKGAIVHKFYGAKRNMMMAQPEGILRDPKPPFGEGLPRYQWRIRTELSQSGLARDRETNQMHASGRIRYVETDEVNQHCEYAVNEEYATANNTYVTCQSFILCEIMDPNLAYDTYKYPVDSALQRLTNLPAEVAEMPETRIGDKAASQVRVINSKRGE